MAAPSFLDLLDLYKAEVILKRPTLGVRIGDISEMIGSGISAIGDRIIGWAAERFAATYLDGAVGDDLTQLASDHWNVTRRAALKASGVVTVTRSGADATAQNMPIGTVFASARDSRGVEVRFVSTSAASWAISENGAKTINVQAEVAGTNGNLSAINQITRIVSSPPAGGTYTITASTQPAGGAPEQDDISLREQVRQLPNTLRRGTIDAVEYGAINTPLAGVVKANVVTDPISALVTVYVSDASGNSSGTTKEVNPATVDDGTMTAKVARELLSWAPIGSLVNVSGGSVQIVNVTVAVVVRIGVDVNQLIADIQTAITARMNRLTIGETLYKSDIINAAKAVDPDAIVDVALVTPTVDTAPTTTGHLIRPGVITVQ